MKNFITHTLSIFLGICFGSMVTIGVYQYKTLEDKCKEYEEGETATIKWRQNHFVLNDDNLHQELIAQGVEFPEIVKAQAVLETGNFKSNACKENNNLFGLRNSNGTYMSFEHWTLSVAAYKKYIQDYKRKPKNYYAYLENLGYAEDPKYINKLKELVNKK